MLEQLFNLSKNLVRSLAINKVKQEVIESKNS
jgi:hypothetical protein